MFSMTIGTSLPLLQTLRSVLKQQFEHLYLGNVHKLIEIYSSYKVSD